MAINDAFSAEIVALVRRMPDEAILALVRNQLFAVSGPFVGSPGSGRGRSGANGGRAFARRRGSGKRAPSADRQNVLNQIERIVKGSSGMSAGEIARAASIPQTRAAAALKTLKL